MASNDSTDKGGIQFCTKGEGSTEVGVKAVLSADGNFGIGVEGEPQARLHVAGDAIFQNGHCKSVNTNYINASVDVMVQGRSVRGDLEQLRKANATVVRRLEEEVKNKERQLANLTAVMDESFSVAYAEMQKKFKELRDKMLEMNVSNALMFKNLHEEILKRDERLPT